MKSARGGKSVQLILATLRMKLYLSLGFGFSKLFPARDALLIRADKRARRRATFLQQLPARMVILAAVGTFFYFFATENEVGLISVLYLLPPLIIPIAVLLGAFITTKVDSIDVGLRREYERLSADLASSPVSCPGVAIPKSNVEERMRDRRANRYQETRQIHRRTRLSRVR